MSTSTTRHAYRVAGAVALPFVAGEALGWSMPFLASIFALQLLAVRQPPHTAGAGLAAVLGLTAAFAAALALSAITLPYPLVFMLGAGLAVFGALYGQARNGSPFWFILLIAICTTPLLASQEQALASAFVEIAVASMLAAVLTAWLMHALFPDPKADAPAAPPTMEPPAAARAALIGTLVLMPLLLLLLGYQSAAAVVTITALSLLKASSAAESTRTAAGLLAANVLAGLAAVAAYAAVSAVPTLAMLAAVTLALGLAFAERITAGGRGAALATAACIAALVLFGLGLTPFYDSATAFTTRLVQVLAASAYTVGALLVLEKLLPPR